MNADWWPAFVGGLLGSSVSYAVALVARGTALETDVRELAMALHERVRQGAMTVDGATALLDACRPPTRRLAARRARRVNRTLDVWPARFDEVHLLVQKPAGVDDRSYHLEQGLGGAE